jgi:hypothetical protein
MTWRCRWQWFVDGVVAAWRDAQRDDPCIREGFERRVGEMLERERPAIAAAAADPPPLPDTRPAHDQPSGQTVRLVAVKPPLDSIGQPGAAREMRGSAR